MERGDGDPAGGVVPISVAQMVLAIAALALDGSISAWLRLGMHWQLAVAAVRVVLQLTALGWALSPIFLRDWPPLTAAYLTLALFLAAAESVSRSRQIYRSMFAHALVALATPCVLLLLYACFVVVRPRPWWTARTAVPVMGMLLGNACSAVALALDSLLDSLKNGSERVEALLALGATRWEASREALRAAVRASMTPTINQMNVAGIVAIPGLMTGQILGGGSLPWPPATRSSSWRSWPLPRAPQEPSPRTSPWPPLSTDSTASGRIACKTAARARERSTGSGASSLPSAWAPAGPPWGSGSACDSSSAVRAKPDAREGRGGRLRTPILAGSPSWRWRVLVGRGRPVAARIEA